MKELIEKRNDLIEKMQNIIDGAKAENRAMSEEELVSFNEADAEVRSITSSIEAEAKLEKIDIIEQPEIVDAEQRAEEAFCAYVMENRAGEQNMDMTNNGAVIPTTIVDKIIKKVKELSPIYERATVYSVKGSLKIPVWGNANDTHNITVSYGTEFSELTADSGKFTSVDLGGYLVGALTLIGKSVENNAQFSVVDFIVNQMAEEIAAFLEKELLTGSGSANNHATGACSTTNTQTATYKSSVTADDLIDLQAKVPSAYQASACWIMSRATFTAIRKLKDGDSRYLLQDDISMEFPYRLLGKPVFISEHMAAMGTQGNKAILYGDMSGLAVNMREGMSVEVLREHYATQHAIGVVSWFEFDSKVADNDKIACLAMGSSDPA